MILATSRDHRVNLHDSGQPNGYAWPTPDGGTREGRYFVDCPQRPAQPALLSGHLVNDEDEAWSLYRQEVTRLILRSEITENSLIHSHTPGHYPN